MSTEVTNEYAVCTDCDLKFADQDEARAHGTATLDAAIAANPDWSTTTGSVAGHGYRVVNPTQDELIQRRINRAVDGAIEDAIWDAMHNLDRAIERGEVSADEVRDALIRYPDFCDAWDEYSE